MSDSHTPGPGRKSPRRSFWIAIAVIVVTIGFLGSFLGANSRAQTDSQRAHQNLQTSSAEIAATLNLAIQHEQDLAISAGTFIVENPNASESSFIRWVNNVDAFQRYSEILAVAIVDVVRPSQLPAFAARAAINAKESKAPTQTFTLTPPGKRPFYCLVDVEHARPGLTEIPITPPTAWAVRRPSPWAPRSIVTAVTRARWPVAARTSLALPAPKSRPTRS